jgi:hypothetical protein
MPYFTFTKLSKVPSDVATDISHMPQWRPGEPTSLESNTGIFHVQVPQLPELPECFKISRVERNISPVEPNSPDSIAESSTSSVEPNSPDWIVESSASPVELNTPPVDSNTPPCSFSLPDPSSFYMPPTHPRFKLQNDPSISNDTNTSTISYLYKDLGKVRQLEDKIKDLENALTQAAQAGPGFPYCAYYEQMIQERYNELEQLECNQAIATSVEIETCRLFSAPALNPSVEYMIGSEGPKKLLQMQQEEQDTWGGLAKSEVDGQVSNKMDDFDKTLEKAPVIVARSGNGDGAKRRRLKLSPLSDLEL